MNTHIRHIIAILGVILFTPYATFATDLTVSNQSGSVITVRVSYGTLNPTEKQEDIWPNAQYIFSSGTTGFKSIYWFDKKAGISYSVAFPLWSRLEKTGEFVRKEGGLFTCDLIEPGKLLKAKPGL